MRNRFRTTAARLGTGYRTVNGSSAWWPLPVAACGMPTDWHGGPPTAGLGRPPTDGRGGRPAQGRSADRRAKWSVDEEGRGRGAEHVEDADPAPTYQMRAAKRHDHQP